MTDIELATQLHDALPGRIGVWAKEIASAAMATAPADVGPMLWALVLAAIMDRESGGGRYLIPYGPGGVGDRGHGRGLMQIDDRDRPPFPGRAAFVRGVEWKDPAKNIMFGARVLATYYDHASGHLGRAIAAYNAGPVAFTAKDPDSVTTGKNYSRDVLARVDHYSKSVGATPLPVA
jgi:soluble lytic murein transglycosylase-like protein